MNWIDWAIIALYLAGMIGLSVFLGRGQTSSDDYYVGGRNLPWWAVGISTMATQTSAVSFLSIPAFVAIKEGGGLSWLQYELAVPLAMIAVMVLLIPFFRKLELVSVYEYLEHRFGPKARTAMSLVFLISRGLATGAGLYASALVLEVILGMPLWATIMLLGVITVIYDTIGGMAAVVYSDVIQMVILLGGIGLCVYFAAEDVGGFSTMFETVPPERYEAFINKTGIGDGAKVPFWAYLIGGFFLYASYYGADQSQTQRELSAPTTAATKYSLILNGFCRFPLTVAYILMGVAIGAAYLTSPELQSQVAEMGKADYMVPVFILERLPTGLRALIIAAILAAAMSSLDSALNSLSAATLKDFVERGRDIPADKLMRYGKITTVCWGIFCIGFAFIAGGLADTVIEAINKIGSTFYGPILASFVVGVLSKRVNELGVLAGIVGGVLVNLALWMGVDDLHWMWWNVIGFVVTWLVAQGVSLASAKPSEETIATYTLMGSGLLKKEVSWLPVYGGLVAYFVVILLVVLFAEDIFV